MNTLLIILALWIPTITHRVKDDATHEMLRVIAQEKDRVVREEAEEALRFIVDPDVTNIVWALPVVDATEWSSDEVLQNIRAPDTLTQEAAVHAAGERGLTNAVSTLLPLLNDEDESLRQTTCAALKTLRAAASVPAVAERLAMEESSLVRRAAVEALLAVHNDVAQAEFLRLLQHQRWQAREAGAQGIQRWGNSELAVPVQPLLNDETAAVQIAAADALGMLRHPASESKLLTRLPAAPAAVQAHIIWALGELRSVQAVPYFVDWVKGTNDILGQASAEALGKIKDERVIPALRHVLYNVTYQQGRTRLVALRLLRELGDDELSNRMVQFVTDKVIPPPPGTVDPMYDSVEARSEALRYLAVYGRREHGESLLSKFSDAAPPDLRPLLAKTLTKLLGQPYRPIPNQDYQRYFVESLGPVPFALQPPKPGVVPE